MQKQNTTEIQKPELESDRVQELHKVLRQSRKELRLTLEQAGDALGIGSSYLSRLERESPRLTEAQCRNFAIVYGLNLQTLMRLSEHSDPREETVPVQAIHAAFEFVRNDPTRIGVMPEIDSLEAKASAVVYWQERSSRQLLRPNEQRALSLWAREMKLEEDSETRTYTFYSFTDLHLSSSKVAEMKKFFYTMTQWRFEPWNGEQKIEPMSNDALDTTMIPDNIKRRIEEGAVAKLLAIFGDERTRHYLMKHLQERPDNNS